jgi:hypothetical protein
MAKVTGTLRDVYKNLTTDEVMLVIAHPRVNGKVAREHINIRQRDLVNAHIGDLKIGSDVVITGEVSEYFNNGAWKFCVDNIKSIRKN